MWKTAEVIGFCSDCIEHGVKAVSLGGGEPFEYEGIFEIIDALYPCCYLSVTTNGLPLEDVRIWNLLMQHRPDKIHVTIHQPQDENEVNRVEKLIRRIAELGIKPGLNLLVEADKIPAATRAYERLSQILNRDQIILVPQRYGNTPTPKQLATISGGKPFQSPTCLMQCRRPEKFCSVSWDKRVNSCSYAPGKQPLASLTFEGLIEALDRVKWRSCNSFCAKRNFSIGRYLCART